MKKELLIFKGFIPWDDDLDICMPSKDYHRFIELCACELNSNYLLQTKKTEPNAVGIGNGLCKIRDTHSLCINDYENFKKPYNRGISIDIFESIGYPKINPSWFRFLSRRTAFALGFFIFNPCCP